MCRLKHENFVILGIFKVMTEKSLLKKDEIELKKLDVIKLLG